MGSTGCDGLLADGLADGVALAAQQGSGAGAITGPANGLYALIFEATGIHDMGMRFSDASALSIPDTIVRRTYLEHREAIETAMVGTQLLGVRFATLLRFVPLLLLLYAVDAADGLTQRAIRRSCGGRESATSDHRAKYLQMAVLGLGGVGVLAWPGAVPWWPVLGQWRWRPAFWRECSGRSIRSICDAVCTRSNALAKLSTELHGTRVRPASVVSVGIRRNPVRAPHVFRGI